MVLTCGCNLVSLRILKVVWFLVPCRFALMGCVDAQVLCALVFAGLFLKAFEVDCGWWYFCFVSLLYWFWG